MEPLRQQRPTLLPPALLATTQALWEAASGTRTSYAAPAPCALLAGAPPAETPPTAAPSTAVARAQTTAQSAISTPASRATATVVSAWVAPAQPAPPTATSAASTYATPGPASAVRAALSLTAPLATRAWALACAEAACRSLPSAPQIPTSATSMCSTRPPRSATLSPPSARNPPTPNTSARP